MTKHKNRFKNQHNQKRRTRLRPPFFINKNLQFDAVRKRMTMKTDGPTLNEMSNIDTTGNVGNSDMPRPVVERPVSNSVKIKNWGSEYSKEIIIGIVVAFVGLLVTNLIIEHGQHLVRHDKDIEVLQKNDERQDESIDKIKENANELKTDMRLIEQRIDLTSGNSEQSKPNKNKK